jgi:hypothetical protein
MVMRPRKLIVSRFRHTWTSGAIMLECWPTLATIAHSAHECPFWTKTFRDLLNCGIFFSVPMFFP